MRFLLLAGAPLLVLPAAHAQDSPARLEVTPFAGYVLGGRFEADDASLAGADADVDIDESGSFGLIVNFPAEYNTEWELYVSRQATQFDDPAPLVSDPAIPGDLDVTYFHAGGTYLFDGERSRPFIVATVGVTHFEPEHSGFDSESFFSLALGGGYEIAPAARVGLRLEGRVFGTFVDGDESLFCRAGGETSACLIAVKGDILWQWQMLAGLTVRF